MLNLRRQGKCSAAQLNYTSLAQAVVDREVGQIGEITLPAGKAALLAP